MQALDPERAVIFIDTGMLHVLSLSLSLSIEDSYIAW